MGSADTVAEVFGGAGASSVAAAMGSAAESAAGMEVDPGSQQHDCVIDSAIGKQKAQG